MIYMSWLPLLSGHIDSICVLAVDRRGIRTCFNCVYPSSFNCWYLFYQDNLCPVDKRGIRTCFSCVYPRYSSWSFNCWFICPHISYQDTLIQFTIGEVSGHVLAVYIQHSFIHDLYHRFTRPRVDRTLVRRDHTPRAPDTLLPLPPWRVCPPPGAGLTSRPVRPATAWGQGAGGKRTWPQIRFCGWCGFNHICKWITASCDI